MSTSIKYIDGLRGFAAISVLNFHILSSFTDAPQLPFGWERNQYLWPTSIPIVRLLFGGPSMVMLFFCVSGFVCSIKPLKAIRDSSMKSKSEMLTYLSSSILRRWFRLYLPVLVWMFFVAILSHLGAFSLFSWYKDDEWFIHVPEFIPEQKNTIMEQLQFWMRDMYDFTYPWDPWPRAWHMEDQYYQPRHNSHLWFVTVEFKASLLLYSLLLLLANAQPRARYPITAGLACYIFLMGKIEILPYIFGLVLAQIKLDVDDLYPDSEEHGHLTLQRPHQLESLPYELRSIILSPQTGEVRTFITREIRPLGIFFSLWLLSTPAWSWTGPGYAIIAMFIPEDFVRVQSFMHLLGVFGLIFCLITNPSTSMLNKALTSRWALWLGKRSFSIYIIHGTVLFAIGWAVPIALWQFLGRDDVTFWVGMVLAEIVTLVISLNLADLFHRYVEPRCDAFTRMIEHAVTGTKQEKFDQNGQPGHKIAVM